jgi:hypothetical protein
MSNLHKAQSAKRITRILIRNLLKKKVQIEREKRNNQKRKVRFSMIRIRKIKNSRQKKRKK